MALQLTIPDPQDVDVTLDSTYARIVAFNVDFTPGNEHAAVVLDIYRSEAARNGGKPSVARVQVLMPTETQEEQTDKDGNVTVPHKPSFSDEIAANIEVYNALKTALYNYIKTYDQTVKNANPVDLV